MPYKIRSWSKGGRGYAESTSISGSIKTKAEAKKRAKKLRKEKAGVKRRLKKQGIKFQYRVTIRKSK